MLTRIGKGIVGIIGLIVFIFFYLYYWGPMYDGRLHRQKVFLSEPQVMLMDYYRNQSDYFKAHKKYSVDLHEQSAIGQEIYFKLGFNDVPKVKKYCPDCYIKEDHYKIASYASKDGKDYLLTIDSNGKLEAIKE